VGKLVGHDQVQNLIINDAEERVYSPEEAVELVPLGLYVIRGDNVALVGEATEWKDDLQAEPIPPIQQNIL
jgi:U6 snRNA-associated Sm-like protein LSm8